MNICVLGWYGTETLGDRAILIGLLRVFKEAFGECHIFLGSLFPFFTERTLFEETRSLPEAFSEMEFSIFNPKNKESLVAAIRKCDFTVIGGGPLMDISEMEIIKFALRKAKGYGKRTAILGCGVGPFTTKTYARIAGDLIRYADLVICRDMNSIKEINSMGVRDIDDIFCFNDPALIPVFGYSDRQEAIKKNEDCVICLRKFPELAMGVNCRVPVSQFIRLVSEAAASFKKVLLIPMHSFYVGGDDRLFLNEIALDIDDNVEVVNDPPALGKLFDFFACAKACIGMRYHSVVFQTFLNGNNYIIDYANPVYGKIRSFIDLVDIDGFYEDRYCNIQSGTKANQEFDPKKIISSLITDDISGIDLGMHSGILRDYSQAVRKLMA
jgi:polysaccharide pyruvyl transferase WcaK-like protein